MSTMAPITRRGAASNRFPPVYLFMVLNLAAWLVYLAFIGSESLRHVHLDTIADNVYSSPLLALHSTPVSSKEAAQLLKSRLDRFGVPPIQCGNVLQDARIHIELDPNQGKLFARYASDNPHFYISVHHKLYDKVRWPMFEESGSYYEIALSNCFRQVLSPNKDKHFRVKRVLDVGGNIGWYALLSAALGAQVATFEPHMPNYLRMCESQCLNHWLHDPTKDSDSITNDACPMGGRDLISEKIHIFPYAVSDENKTLHFSLTKKGNPGMGQIVDKPTNRSTPIQCVTLDDMVEALGWTTGAIDILKVDVEGAEIGVFMGAKKLLKSRRVHNIFMEGNVRLPSEMLEFETLVKLLMDSGYHLFQIGGYSGPDPSIPIPKVDQYFIDNLISVCGNYKPARQCNMWWKLKSALFKTVA